MSILTADQQELFDLAKGTIPRFFFQKATAAQEILGGAAVAFAAAKTQISSWFGESFIKDASNFWLDQHARDRGLRRQSSEGDPALSSRTRSYQDAQTVPALTQIVNNLLTAAGYPASAVIVELRAAGAYYQDEGRISLQAFFGRGNRWSGRRHNIVCILPPGVDAGTVKAALDALGTWAAGGIGIAVETGSNSAAYTRVSVTPPAGTVAIGGSTLTFAAQTRRSESVTWKVNGITGGNTTVGTISAGVYTSPGSLPLIEDVEVQAVSTLDTSVIGRARVKLH